MENVFVANGKRFCTKGRRPLVFRIPIRNVPFSIRYIFVSKKHEGRNFVPRAEGPWFVGAGRRLFVDICTIESGRDPTNYYQFLLVGSCTVGELEVKQGAGQGGGEDCGKGGSV